MELTAARTTVAWVALSVSHSGSVQSESVPVRGDETAEAAASLGPDGPRTEVRDVDRPDIFSVTETGLWDGRPSLGGIWVAHPDVSVPERAKITNTSNGKTIAGALFRRERANPGPRIQVSSDAASALGMLAGQPSELTIVAVRQEQIELEPEPLPLADEAPGEPGQTEQAPDDATAAAAVAGAAAADASAGQPKRQGFWARFRDSLRNKPASDVATEAETALIEQTSESAAVPDVETATLDPVASVAAAAIAEAEGEAATPQARPAPSSSVSNPIIQVGLFSVEDNASAAAASLRQAGIVPEIRGQKSGDATLWRVFVGPVSNADEQATLLAQIKKLGYTDAFLAPK